MKNALIFIFILFCTAVQAQTATLPATTAAKCTAVTKTGEKCKNSAVTPLTVCRVHNPDGPKCGQNTESGTPCKRSVKQSGQNCVAHSTPKQ